MRHDQCTSSHMCLCVCVCVLLLVRLVPLIQHRGVYPLQQVRWRCYTPQILHADQADHRLPTARRHGGALRAVLAEVSAAPKCMHRPSMRMHRDCATPAMCCGRGCSLCLLVCACVNLCAPRLACAQNSSYRNDVWIREGAPRHGREEERQTFQDRRHRGTRRRARPLSRC
jgi:hypothetical protein